jgi:hypothetical protein
VQHLPQPPATTAPSNDSRGITLVCDNKSMVDKVNEITAYQQVYPNSTMDPEGDVLAEIRGTMIQALDTNLKPDVNWIKGHQDEDTPYDELPLQAQLNCDADALAEEYLREATIDFTKTPIMPTSGCQLHLPQGTITHDIKGNLSLPVRYLL